MCTPLECPWRRPRSLQSGAHVKVDQAEAKHCLKAQLFLSTVVKLFLSTKVSLSGQMWAALRKPKLSSSMRSTEAQIRQQQQRSRPEGVGTRDNKRHQEATCTVPLYTLISSYQFVLCHTLCRKVLESALPCPD